MSGRKPPRRISPRRKSPPSKKQIDAGSYIEGSANVEGGDIVSGNKNIGMRPDEIIQLVDALSKHLAPHFRDPNRLDDALQKFQNYHQALHEWKELHNSLHTIKIAFDPYNSQVDRIKVKEVAPSLTNLKSLWRPVSRAINVLIDFSKKIKIIGIPYKDIDGQLQGERWSIEITALRNDLERILNQYPITQSSTLSLNITSIIGSKPKWWNNLLEVTGEFKSVVDSHLDWCDKNLREAATELYNLSEMVFRRQ